MRIISGEFKGRVLKSPIPDGVRPTTDKNRETVFNIINNYVDFDEVIVLDLFSGAGMLGIEALSRGAEFCIFNDKNHKVNKLIDSFIDELQISKSRLANFNLDGFSLLTQLLINQNLLTSVYNTEHKINLVFSDPPYSLRAGNKLLNIINTHFNEDSAISSNCIFVFEYSYTETINYNLLGIESKIEVLQQKKIGETKIDIVTFK